MIRVRGLAVSDDEAAELARRLHELNDPHGDRIAERLERGLLVGTALVGTDPAEARVTLLVIEEWAPERLRAVAEDLRQNLRNAAA